MSRCVMSRNVLRHGDRSVSDVRCFSPIDRMSCQNMKEVQWVRCRFSEEIHDKGRGFGTGA